MRSRRTARSSLRRVGVFALSLVILVAVGVIPTSADTQVPPQPGAFDGLAAAHGTQVVFTLPRAPLTEKPLDGGGPTAQVALSSSGAGTGYAAFPDPGPTVLSLPGLTVGLATGGLGVAGPAVPTYPLYVTTDADVNPKASVGDGPYALRSETSRTSSASSATGGVQGDGLGTAGLVATSALVAIDDEGGVEARAVSDVQGLTIGPLSVGQVHAEAAQTMAPDGTITRTRTLEVSGMKVGGLPVAAVKKDGVEAGTTTVALPLAPAQQALLDAANLRLDVIPAESGDGHVTAPALRISGVLPEVPNAGFGAPVYTLTLGSAVAQLVGEAASVDGGQPSSGAVASATAAPLDAGQAATVSRQPAAMPAVTAGNVAVQPIAHRARFSILHFYALLTAACFALFIVGQMARIVGVRQPWK